MIGDQIGETGSFQPFQIQRSAIHWLRMGRFANVDGGAGENEPSGLKHTISRIAGNLRWYGRLYA